MSNNPVIGIYYDLSTGIVTKQVNLDFNSSDSDDNVKQGLRNLISPGEGLVFIPAYRAEGDLEEILNGLGIQRYAIPLQS